MEKRGSSQAEVTRLPDQAVQGRLRRLILPIAGLAMAALAFSYAVLSAQADTAPVISSTSASTTDSAASITWTTDVPATSQIAYGTTTAYDSFSAFDPGLVTSHSVTLTPLLPGTLYHYQIASMGTTTGSDIASSTSLSSDLTFMTAGASSTATSTASSTPVISGIVVTPSDTTAGIAWMTDIPADGQILYGTSSAYTATTSLNSNLLTSHAMTLMGLDPDTTYHFQIWSTASSSATSTDQTFTTAMSSSTASSTIGVSNVVANPSDTSANIAWMTSGNSTTQVEYGTTTGYGNMTTLDSALTTDHSATLMSLVPSTLYHFRIWTGNASTSASSTADYTFTTLAPAGTSTGSSTADQIQALWDEIAALKAKIALLMQQIQDILNNQGGGNNGGGTGTTTPPTSSASIDQNGQSVRVGTGIDFGGRNFGNEEHVNVMLNGAKIGEGFTNGAGSFSTGSMSVPSTPGTYTYTFVGQVSGKTATATITLTP